MANTIAKREQQRPVPARAENLDARRVITPPVDIFENDQELLLVADLPGVRKEDLRINVEKEQLTLEARRFHENAAGAQAGEGVEPVVYRRAFTAAQVFDLDKVNARLEKGVLLVRLPKAESIRPRQIKVQTS